MAGLVERGLRTICFAKSAPGRRARSTASRPTGVDRELRDAARAVPRRLHARAAARDRAPPRRGRAARRLGAPTRSSSGSTSACSTARSRSASPARWRRCASSGAGPAAAGTGSAILVASEDALDQYFMREPETLLNRRVEARDPRPREPARARRPRPLGRVRGAARRRRPRDPRRRRARARRGAPRAPAHAARLGLGREGLPGRARAAPLDEPRLVHGRRRDDRHDARPRRARARVLDRRTRARSTSTSASRTSCDELDLEAAPRVVSPFRGDWYTQAKKETTTEIVEPRAGRAAARARARVRRASSVTEQVIALPAEVDPRRQSTLETRPLDLPETTFETEAVWYLPEPEQLAGDRRDARAPRQRSTRPSTR